jgi:hypothetical protein
VYKGIQKYLSTTELVYNNNKFQKSGAYQLTSNYRRKVYVGQIDSSFEIKFKEHFFSFKNNNYHSAFHNLF